MHGKRQNPETVEQFTNALIAQLIERRKELSISQQDLGAKIGVADNLVGKWECGMRLPSGFLLYCWTEALNLRITLEETHYG
tara:strand:+ start:25415 stop:25660 length:246 start_codon:yes stop_codon:yes gene_type:complete